MMSSGKEGQSSEPPLSPSKDSLDGIIKLIGDILASLKASILSVED